jgi:class 3 adenylate cyclase/WD40 repeat protein/energy-coupling factor transporter ATP-binding protein EcfA2
MSNDSLPVTAEPPSGTVTFLFTDVEGSTRLLMELKPDGYQAALAEHQGILRAVFAERDGREINTRGDSFFVAFARTTDAVAAAVEAQRRLDEHAWPQRVQFRVRMGLHSGESVAAPDGYVGIGVHRTARISATAHGGQVLVSQATRELLRDDPLPGVSLLDLGLHELKDFDEPERIFQVTAPGLRESFPPLRTTTSPPPPTGVLTFLISTVDAPATSLWDTEHEAVGASLAGLWELIARVAEPQGGRFRQSMGESGSSLGVFESAVAAVRAAVDTARALGERTWPDGAPMRARFGLHTGEAQVEGGRYYGTAVTLAARVCDEADQGEILLSETTAALATAALPAGYAVVDLGRYRLEGVERPQAIKALVGPGLRTTAAALECPYRGLLAFGPEHRDVFFGREEVMDDVRSRIAPGRLLVVVGASGSGKSSLLQAGVLAEAQRGELPRAGSARLITPGSRPPLDLGKDPSELLIVDQFEEIYTQCRDVGHRARFVEAMLSRAGPVVIGVRADFYGNLSTDPALAFAAASNQVLLGPMVDDDLRRAIAEPARLAGLRLERGLVDVVLRDVGGEPGALPLMSHALRETWERRVGRKLTLEGYRESGGVSSALAQTADAVWEETAEHDRPLLRNLFLRLTGLGDDTEDTRRRVPVAELIPERSSEQAVRTLLERLVEARLVVLDEETAEVAHEVLIRRWPMLRRWIDEDREGIRVHRRLGDAARLWDASGREPADLYRGTRLDAALEWAGQNRASLNGTEREFLDASVEEAARTQRSQVKANRRLLRALVAAGCLLAATAGLLVWALFQRSNAVHSAKVATSLALASDATSVVSTNVANALLLALTGYQTDPTPQARTAVTLALQTAQSSGVDAILRSCGEVNDVAFVPGGTSLAVGCYNGNTALWNLAEPGTRDEPVILPGGSGCDSVDGVALDTGARTLASGCANGNTLVWGVARGKLHGAPVTIPGGSSCDKVDHVAFGSRGHTLAVGCANGNTVLWPMAHGKPRGGKEILPSGRSCSGVDDLDFGSGGRTLAVGCADGNTLLWAIASGKPHGVAAILPAGRVCDSVNGIAFAPDGGTLAVACDDGNTRLWRLDGGKPYGDPITLAGGSACDAAEDVAFGSGPGTLAIGCNNGDTVVWNLEAASPSRETLTFTGGSSCDSVNAVAFAAGGATLAVGCADGNTALREIVAGKPDEEALTLPGGDRCGGVNAVAFTGPLAIACQNGDTVLWRVAAGRVRGGPTTLPGGNRCRQALAIALAIDGRSLAVGCGNGDAVLRNVAARAPGRPITLPGGSSCVKALAVAFGSGTGTLAVGCGNGNTLLWSTAAGKPPRRPTVLPGGSSCSVVYGLAFDSDGRTLAVGCFNGDTVLWNVVDGKPLGAPTILPPGSSCDAVYGVAFGPDGKTLAVGCRNGNIVLWSTAKARPHGLPVTLPSVGTCDPLLGVTFSSAGTLAASCKSGNAVLWDIAKGKQVAGPLTLPTVAGCENAYSLAFGSGGGPLAIGCANGNTTVWNVVPWATSYADVKSRACRFVWGDLTPSEWNALVRGLPYQRPCAQPESSRYAPRMAR